MTAGDCRTGYKSPLYRLNDCSVFFRYGSKLSSWQVQNGLQGSRDRQKSVYMYACSYVCIYVCMYVRMYTYISLSVHCHGAEAE